MHAAYFVTLMLNQAFFIISIKCTKTAVLVAAITAAAITAAATAAAATAAAAMVRCYVRPALARYLISLIWEIVIRRRI